MLTEKQKECIYLNLQAFTANFGQVRIEKEKYSGFYVYYPEDSDSFVFFAEDIKTINGWLYGAVQAYHRIIPVAKRENKLLV